MPKRKHQVFSDSSEKLKQDVPVINSGRCDAKQCGLIESKMKDVGLRQTDFTYQEQGWEFNEDPFEGILHQESEMDWMEQTSISSIFSQPNNTSVSMINSEDEVDNVEINSPSQTQHINDGHSANNIDADGCINSVSSSSVSFRAISPAPSGSQKSIVNDNNWSDDGSEIIIEASNNSRGSVKAKYSYENISDRSIILTPSPVLVNEGFHFSSQASSSEGSSGRDQLELNPVNQTGSISSGSASSHRPESLINCHQELNQPETASISSESASPQKQNMLKGSEWLHSVFAKMPAAAPEKLGEGNIKFENPHNECFKKIPVVKGGLAEKLENILLDLKTDAELQSNNGTSGNPGILQIKIKEMALFSSCHVVADCEKITNSAASSSKVTLETPADQTLAVVFTKNVMRRWTVCNGCVLSIAPSWQIIHMPAMRKSFILCPSVVDVAHCPNIGANQIL